MFAGNSSRNNQTVSVNSSSYEEDEKNDGIEEKEDNRKKREWTPAREAAWAKCLEGRQRYMETKRELTAKEAEDKKMKEKIRMEMLKKQIRSEIEAELKIDKQNMTESETDAVNTKEQECKVECEEVSNEKPKKLREKTKKRVVVESSDSSESSTESSSEEDRKRRRRRSKKKEKRHSHKKRKRYYSSSSSESENEVEQAHPAKHPQPHGYAQPPNSYLRSFSFV
jgi:hypothetical protein